MRTAAAMAACWIASGAAGLLSGASAAGPSAEEIMARVAENQGRAVEMRSAFVYHQNVLVRLKRGNGRLAREEQRDITVTPTATGSAKHIDRFEGRYEKHGKLIAYSRPGYTYKEMDIDGELVGDLAEDLTGDGGSRDGLGKTLFPLTAELQKRYSFRLEGSQEYNGREVYRVLFQPNENQDFAAWAGEVLVDAGEYQPVLITTRLAHGIPLVVRTLLGTNLRYLGFKVAYQKFADGVWFPVRYGGEFDLRAAFLYRRKISISMINSGFQRADVDSRVSYDLSDH